MVDGHANVHCDTKTTDARIDCQARASRRLQELDLCIESPAAEPAASAMVHVRVGATLRQNRRESFNNGCHGRTECTEAREPWLAFSFGKRSKNDRASTLRGEPRRPIVGSHTKAAHLRTPCQRWYVPQPKAYAFCEWVGGNADNTGH